MGESGGDRVSDRDPHPRLVHLIRTRMRDRHDDERQAGGSRLRLEHIATHGMHRHAIHVSLTVVSSACTAPGYC